MCKINSTNYHIVENNGELKEKKQLFGAPKTKILGGKPPRTEVTIIGFLLSTNFVQGISERNMCTKFEGKR